MADKPDPKPDVCTISVTRELAGYLRTIADQRDITIPEAFERFAGGPITREYKRIVAEMHAAVLGGES